MYIKEMRKFILNFELPGCFRGHKINHFYIAVMSKPFETYFYPFIFVLLRRRTERL
ncbi:MAG TPA: hypothetical protein PLQ41_04535 [bacterium]|nr:hypothetical protein [bacterium]HPP30427.1 hypothetical protein [bacterium]